MGRVARTRLTPLVALLALLVESATLHAAGLVAGRLNEFRFELPNEVREFAGRGHLSPITHALVTVAVPPDFDAARDWPVLIVCATMDRGYNSSRRLLGQYAAAAQQHGWILLAADAEQDAGDDHIYLRYALDVAALTVLQLQWPRTDSMPLAFGGFSGGAKCSGWLAAMFASRGRAVSGIYLAGINEDTVVPAARELSVLDASYREIPVFLQSGRSDDVATPANHRDVADKLRRAGFSHVRIEYFDGPHTVDAAPFGEALDWFRQMTSPSRAAQPPATPR